jgi:hypothetical protein
VVHDCTDAGVHRPEEVVPLDGANSDPLELSRDAPLDVLRRDRVSTCLAMGTACHARSGRAE